MQEEPPGYSTTRTRPRVLVLEEGCEALIIASNSLRDEGYSVTTIADEKAIVDRSLNAPDKHVLVLTAHTTCQPLTIPKALEGLRRRDYPGIIAYCIKGKLTRATEAAYEALSVDRVLALPGTAQKSIAATLAWVAGHAALHEGGLTIVEI